MKLSVAMPIARRIGTILRPFCLAVLCVGSIRRQVPEVNDIEFCVVPDPKLLAEFYALVDNWQPVKGSARGKYTRRHVPFSALELDLFICSRETWGCNTLIRTGPARFSTAVVCRAQKMGWKFEDARLWNAGAVYNLGAAVVHTPTEKDVFRALGLPYYPPEKRTDFTAREISRMACPEVETAQAQSDLFGEVGDAV